MRLNALSVVVSLAVGIPACGNDIPPLYDAPDITWTDKASDLDETEDKNLLRDCPPNGTAYDVWGGPIYRDESSICTAAVHAGKINLTDGGRIKLRLIAGEDSYQGSSFNGITTLDYNAPGNGSFEFP